MDYTEIIKERVKILPEGLKDFVMNENWRSDIKTIGEEFSLNEEEYASLENEIFLVLLCFELRKDFIENIKNELNTDGNTANWIAEDVDKNIFNQVKEDLDEIEKEINQNTEQEKETPTQSQNNIGTSFEQIILNQAKAMQPARPAGWVPPNLPTQNPTTNQKREVPPTSPTNEEKTTSEKKVIHNYISEPDPYREPIE